MKSVNYALRTAYVTSLNGLTVNGSPVPVYYLSAPESETGQYYVTLNSPANSDISVKGSADSRTAMQVQIHTWANGSNAGKIADDLADDVYAAIYPTPASVLDLSPDFQMVSTRVDNDLVQELDGIGQEVFVIRIITFSHRIFHIG